MSPKSRPLPASRIVGLAALLLATSIGYPAPDASADRPFGAALRCNGRVVTVNLAAGHRPTRGNDVISATRRADVIRARGGNDIICARGGNDVVIGGRGNDIILGGLGADRLSGGQGRDTVIGGVGNDLVGGGPGPDRLRGGHGRDIVVGGLGNDFLSGGAGFDRLSGGAGRDWLNGGAGRDRCAGGRHVDRGTLCSTMTGIETRAPRTSFPIGNPGSNKILIRPSAPQPGPADSSGNFRIFCGYSHMSHDDPIVYPNQPGRAHLHTFFGNKGADAASTYHSLRTTGNGTCSGGIANRTAYWVPTLLDAAGQPVKPKYAQIYYKSGYRSVRPTDINHIPNGLRMVAGKASATRNQSMEIVEWEGCGNYSARLRTCGAGEELIMAITFPQCWNGRDLDSPDHISHMAYPTYGIGCPSSHPVAIPVITTIVYWSQPAGDASKIRLSSDLRGVAAGVSAHADFFEAWVPTIRNRWTELCVRGHLNCTRGLGDSRQLVDPPGMTWE